jgi:hypothetical protein
LGKVEYSDLYKFMVSAGVALITIAFIAPWLYFREPFDLLVDETRLGSLTKGAKWIVQFRQEAVFWIWVVIMVMSAVALIGGSILLLSGLDKWQKVQTVADSQAQATLDKTLSERSKLDAERDKLIKDMSSSDVMAKVEQERSEDTPEVAATRSEQEEKAPEPVDQQIKEAIPIRDYLLLEDLTVDFFARSNRNGVVLRNKRIGKFQYDGIIQVPSNAPYDIIVEVKATLRTGAPSRAQIKDAIQHSGAEAKNYIALVERRAKTHLVFIVRDNKSVRETELRIEDSLSMFPEFQDYVIVQVFPEALIRRAVESQAEAAS